MLWKKLNFVQQQKCRNKHRIKRKSKKCLLKKMVDDKKNTRIPMRRTQQCICICVCMCNVCVCALLCMGRKTLLY